MKTHALRDEKSCSPKKKGKNGKRRKSLVSAFIKLAAKECTSNLKCFLIAEWQPVQKLLHGIQLLVVV